jgi:peptidoglycan/LPS O-acetylase OafA/YrhL
MFLLGLALGSAVLFSRMGSAASASAGPFATALATNSIYLPYTGDLAQRAMSILLVATPKIFPSNPPTWSLFFEVVASIAFVGLIRLKRPVLPVLVVISFVVFAAAGALNEWMENRVAGIDFNLGWSPAWPNLLGGLPRVFYAFPLGMLIYTFTREEISGPWRSVAQRWVPSPFALYLVLLLVLLIPFDARGAVSLVVLTTIAPALIFCGAVVTCNNAVSYSSAKFLGSLSYPVYCLHFPIERAVFFLSQRYHVPNTIALLAAIALTLGASMLLLRFYDAPVRRSLRKRFALASGPRPDRTVVAAS